jgi:hypothetical protein
MSAPSYRSRYMMYAFDQIISSGGTSFTGTPSTSPSSACSNHAASTSAIAFPELKMRSTKSSPQRALPSQIGEKRTADAVRYRARGGSTMKGISSSPTSGTTATQRIASMGVGATPSACPTTKGPAAAR